MTSRIYFLSHTYKPNKYKEGSIIYYAPLCAAFLAGLGDETTFLGAATLVGVTTLEVFVVGVVDVLLGALEVHVLVLVGAFLAGASVVAFALVGVAFSTGCPAFTSSITFTNALCFTYPCILDLPTDLTLLILGQALTSTSLIYKLLGEIFILFLAFALADLTTLSKIFAALFGRKLSVISASLTCLPLMSLATTDNFFSEESAYFNVAVILLSVMLFQTIYQIKQSNLLCCYFD